MSLVLYKLSAAVPPRHQLLPTSTPAFTPSVKVEQLTYPVLPLDTPVYFFLSQLVKERMSQGLQRG